MKHQLSYLHHTYFRVLHAMHSGTFLLQLMKVKDNEYLSTAN